jgi:hypothetical protein
MSRFFEKQAFVENEIVGSINKALVKTRNPAVRAVLMGISLDSVKHAEMYKAAIELLSSVPSALMRREFDELMRFTKKHVAAEEEKAILCMEEVNDHVEDEKIKLLLEGVFSAKPCENGFEDSAIRHCWCQIMTTTSLFASKTSSRQFAVFFGTIAS